MATTQYPERIDTSTNLPPATGDEQTSINANIAATLAIETELGLTPSGTYVDVRTRLDILEARINNPLIPAPNVLNPFFISGTGVSIQTGVGDPNVVLALHPKAGSLYLRQDGYGDEALYVFTTSGSWLPVSTNTNNPTFTQATWFIDPANSTGVASDDNSGLDALHPVLSYNGGVVAKWGTTSPTLNQMTVLTWMSSASANDPVVFTPQVNGTYSAIVGQLGAGQQLYAGSLTSVVSKNHSTGQLLQANLGFAAPIGSIVYNTTSGKLSYAIVAYFVSGTTYKLFQPLAPLVLPVADTGLVPVIIDGWANTDTFVLYQPVFIQLSKLAATSLATDVADSYPPQVQVQHVRASCIGGPGNSALVVGAGVAITESTLDSFLEIDITEAAIGNIYGNIAALFGVFDNAGIDDQEWWGGGIFTPFGSNITFDVNCDTVLDATLDGMSLDSPIGQRIQIGGVGGCYIAGTIYCVGLLECYGSTVWGPGTLSALGTARVFYVPGAATTTFLNAGGLMINELTTANAFNPVTGAWSASITLNPTNLDKTFAGGGFGGWAVNPGGASFYGGLP